MSPASDRTTRSGLEPSDTLWSRLAHWAGEHPEKTAFSFLARGEREAGRLTYGELFIRARRIADHLDRAGLRGRIVLLIYPPGLEFITAFFGCLGAGVVAAPAPYLATPRSMERTAAIAREIRPAAILSVRGAFTATRATAMIPDEAPWLATDEIETPNVAPSSTLEAPEPDALAFLQFTSGSTRQPKGVMVTHANIMANMEAIRCAFRHDPDTPAVSWLPMFHDMGLVGCLMQPVYLGITSVLFSPLSFLQKPVRWLRAIAEHRATTSGAPNFAYELCVRSLKTEDVEALDLSSWSLAFCGAEPVRPDVLRAFADLLRPAGFSPAALYPCYGLAEATLFVSGGVKGEGLRTRDFDADLLSKTGRAAEPAAGAARRTLAGNGRAAAGGRITIADPSSEVLRADGEIGEIRVSGASVAGGYFDRPAESATAFGPGIPGLPGAWLRTGDLGFLLEDELYVTGRLKDLIVVRGANHHPEDLEATIASCHPMFEGGGGAVMTVEEGAREQIVVLQELGRRAVGEAGDFAAAISAAAAAMVERHGLRPDTVALVARGVLPRTTSGKIQRNLCRAAYLEDRLSILACSGPAPVRETDQ